uniref:Ovule protein n=1 Tax=Rhabditophanes sp. KR3021 TaxID=114890 RepID=A0AC35U723_9BILA
MKRKKPSTDLGEDKIPSLDIHSSDASRSKFFFWMSKRPRTNSPPSSANSTFTVHSPDSSKSVYFEDSISWPFIDDDDNNYEPMMS